MGARDDYQKFLAAKGGLSYRYKRWEQLSTPQQDFFAETGELVSTEEAEAALANVDVADMTVDDLKDKAKEMGLSGYSKLNRDELIELVTMPPESEDE